MAILSLCMHIHSVSRSIFNSVQHFTSSFSTYSSHAAVVPTRLQVAHPPASALGSYTRRRWSILFCIQDGGGAFSPGVQNGGGAFSTPET